jgi:alpha-galactosidase
LYNSFRHISDAYSSSIERQGEFFHRFQLGLVEVFERIFKPRSHILLETCSSGGNRFDLGMLTFGPQIWSSDDTDPIERLDIQEGLSYLYPQSTMGAHVSSSPHQQTLRNTPLSTRFNVASFGVLGYEMDLNLLTNAEVKEIKEQIRFYKNNRELFQFGEFSRVEAIRENTRIWQVKAGGHAVAGFFQSHVGASPGVDLLKVLDLEKDKTYEVENKVQQLQIARFGELIKHVSPVKVNPHGILMNAVNQYYTMKDATEEFTVSGGMLSSGIPLKNQFMGSGYSEEIRLLGDFGSTLYTIKEKTTFEN